MSSSDFARRPPAQCVVCQKEIHAGEDRQEVPWRGGHYLVCCPTCAAKFKAAPATHVPDL